MNQITFFIVSTPVTDPVARFFEAAFKWPMSRAGETVFAEPGKGGIGGAIARPSESTGRTGVTLYVEVDDISAALRRVQDAGGHPDGPVLDLADGRGSIAHFQAPDGALFGLYQRATPTKPKASPRKPKSDANAKPKSKRTAAPSKRPGAAPKTTRETATRGR